VHLSHKRQDKIYIDGHEDIMNPGDFVLFRSRGIHSIYTDELEVNDYYCFKIATSHLHSISPKNLKGQFALRFSVFNSQLKFLWRAEELEGSRIKQGIDRIISDIVMAVRINHAEYLIINSDLPISHIATKCGYSNVSHFIQLYKRLKGTTPLQLRKAQDEQ
jgi:AraC-like DNA-binding protein